MLYCATCSNGSPDRHCACGNCQFSPWLSPAEACRPSRLQSDPSECEPRGGCGSTTRCRAYCQLPAVTIPSAGKLFPLPGPNEHSRTVRLLACQQGISMGTQRLEVFMFLLYPEGCRVLVVSAPYVLGSWNSSRVFYPSSSRLPSPNSGTTGRAACPNAPRSRRCTAGGSPPAAALEHLHCSPATSSHALASSHCIVGVGGRQRRGEA